MKRRSGRGSYEVAVNKARNYRRQRHCMPAVGLDPADGFLERLSDPNDDLAHV